MHPLHAVFVSEAKQPSLRRNVPVIPIHRETIARITIAIAVNIGYRGQRGRMYVGVTAGTLVQVGGSTTAAGGENSDVHSSMSMIVPAGHFYKADQMFDLEVWAELV